MTDREALRAAILKALPVDWDDRTTVVEVVPDDGRGHPVTVWGHPERLADAILAAIQPVLDEGVTIEWGIRVDVPHPRRSEKAGEIMTHFDEQKSRRCKEIWDGWTPVSRRRWTSEWEAVA
jgi:hypothetical protein